MEAYWFQHEISDPSLNSNAYDVARQLVNKHFPGNHYVCCNLLYFHCKINCICKYHLLHEYFVDQVTLIDQSFCKYILTWIYFTQKFSAKNKANGSGLGGVSMEMYCKAMILH